MDEEGERKGDKGICRESYERVRRTTKPPAYL